MVCFFLFHQKNQKQQQEIFVFFFLDEKTEKLFSLFETE